MGKKEKKEIGAAELLDMFRKTAEEAGMITTPTMYDPIKFGYSCSFGILEDTDVGTIKRFMINVDDNMGSGSIHG